MNFFGLLYEKYKSGPTEGNPIWKKSALIYRRRHIDQVLIEQNKKLDFHCKWYIFLHCENLVYLVVLYKWSL